jgi:hypothetical protein
LLGEISKYDLYYSLTVGENEISFSRLTRSVEAVSYSTKAPNY